MQARPYHSDRETSTCPTQQRLLGELISKRPYQNGPNDRPWADRVERLRVAIASYESAETVRPMNPKHRGSRPIVSATPANRSVSSERGDAPFHPEHPPARHPNPEIPDLWVVWLDRVWTELRPCLELRRLVLIGDLHFTHIGVPRWVWFLLGQETVLPGRGPSSGRIFELCPFCEIRYILWRGHRLGICRRIAMIIRGTRRPFVGLSYDFEESGGTLTTPTIRHSLWYWGILVRNLPGVRSPPDWETRETMIRAT